MGVGESKTSVVNMLDCLLPTIIFYFCIQAKKNKKHVVEPYQSYNHEVNAIHITDTLSGQQ